MKKKIVLYILIGIIVVFGGISLFVFTRNMTMSDAVKFKEEYESLNNTVRKSDGATYGELLIDKDNPIKYVDIKGAIDVLKKDEAILYIGANWCPYCRNAIPVLFDVAKNYNVDTIYYLNLDEDKDTFEIKDGKLIKTVEGSKDYYKLLEVLSDHLRDYVLYDKDGISYETGEKRIYIPYVLAIKNGEIVSEYTWEIKFNEGQTKYDKLDSEQEKMLYKSYDGLFKLVYGKNDNVCNLDEPCN